MIFVINEISFTIFVTPYQLQTRNNLTALEPIHLIGDSYIEKLKVGSVEHHQSHIKDLKIQYTEYLLRDCLQYPKNNRRNC